MRASHSTAQSFYQPALGNTPYSLVSSLCVALSIQLDNGNRLSITARNNTAHTPYVRAATFGEQSLPSLYIEYEQLMGGGELAFEMSDTPCPTSTWPCYAGEERGTDRLGSNAIGMNVAVLLT